MSRINLLCLWFLVIAVDCMLVHADDASSACIIGADISWVQQQEAEGKQWSDEGVEKDIFAILTDHGFNWARLRIFVNPAAEGGYSKEGFCDLEHTLQMAKRVKAAGMRLLLDFHYSDTWADPGHQRKPKAWAGLHRTELEKAVQGHTKDVMTALKTLTIWPAWQHFEEETKGSIEVGKLADFVLLSDDPTAIDPETLDQLRVQVTIKEDQVIYKAEDGEQDTNLRQSPFMSDPVTAHRFLHAMYRGAGVEKPVVRCLLSGDLCTRLFGAPALHLE